jgi:hypothetical protein
MDVQSYWMTLWKRQDTGNLKKKHSIAFCRQLASAEATDMSQDRLQNE